MEALHIDSSLSFKTEDFLPINGTDFIEFYVGNAKQASFFTELLLDFH